MSDDKATAFGTSFAELYDRYLVPMLFEPYARYVADRAAALRPHTILETAAGTGIVTRELSKSLPAASITVTDLNQPMIDLARAKSEFANVSWQQADAMKLPFADAGFDLLVCQFGVMFFPDKQGAFREARRVLRPGGTFLFVVWNDWKQMPTAPLAIAADVVAELLGRDAGTLLNPPYHDEASIRSDLGAAGFRHISFDRVSKPARAASPRDAAVATVHGSLIRTAIETTAPERLDEATDAVERAMRARLGDGQIDGETSALVVLAN